MIYLHPVIPTGRVVVVVIIMHPQAMAFVRALFLHLVSKYFSRHNRTLAKTLYKLFIPAVMMRQEIKERK